MDLRVEPAATDRSLTIRNDGPSILFPLRTSTLEVEVATVTMSIDRTHWAIVPAGQRLRLRARTPGARVLIATAHASLIEKVVAQNRNVNLDGTRLSRWLAVAQRLPRTVWVDEIVQRYLFERQVCGGYDNDATRFLEAEILKEAYFLLRDRDDGCDRASLVQEHTPAVQRALAYIEAHLFDTPSVKPLARAAGASESTLLRAFKRELGCAPSAYWRMLRLDESVVLLESGQHTVAEVATRVGYDNASAFAHAFQLRFGRSPSELLPR